MDSPAPKKQSYLEKLIGSDSGTLIWWMIDKQKGWKAKRAGIIGLWARISLAYQSQTAGAVFISSMYFHELGHWIMFWTYNIKSRIMLLFPLGAVAAPITPAENTRSDELHWWKISWILVMGPAFNLVLMAIGLWFLKIGFLPGISYYVVYINGGLAVFNLLPLGNMDGGQLFHVILSSLKEIGDFIVTAISFIVAGIVIWYVIGSPIGQSAWTVLYKAFQNFGLLSVVIFIAIGLAHKQGRDNPEHANSPQAMTGWEATFHIALWLVLVVTNLYMFSIFSA